MSREHVWAEFTRVLEVYYRNYPNNDEQNMIKKIKTETLAGSADELVLRHIPEIPSASVR
jgi:hypothetical protein